MTYIGNNQLIILEKTKRIAKFYLINLGKTRKLQKAIANSQNPTIEELTPGVLKRLGTIKKTLLFSTNKFPNFPHNLQGMTLISSNQLLLIDDNRHNLQIKKQKAIFVRITFNKNLFVP